MALCDNNSYNEHAVQHLVWYLILCLSRFSENQIPLGLASTNPASDWKIVMKQQV